MSLTGGISFYDKSKSLFDNGATAVASSNTDDQNLCLGTNKYFKWQSSGSNDSTTETITITLSSSVSISRIFLLDHNFKNFQIQYGSPATDFTNVVGLDSYSENLIDVTGFSRNTAYFEFDAVTTDKIILTIDTTQTADAEKYLVQFIATNELGTLTGYPDIKNVRLDRDESKEKSISGRYHIQKSYESVSFDLGLKIYPNASDVDILDDLHDREESFHVWLCGGKPDQFTTKQRGFRVNDLYLMQVDKPLRNSYYKNIYICGVEQNYSFIEVVD